MNLFLLPGPHFLPLSNKGYAHLPGRGNSVLPLVGHPAPGLELLKDSLIPMPGEEGGPSMAGSWGA